jgi:hypothetical protein
MVVGGLAEQATSAVPAGTVPGGALDAKSAAPIPGGDGESKGGKGELLDQLAQVHTDKRDVSPEHPQAH